MARFFRFRVRKGHAIFEFNNDTRRTTKHGPGFELLLTEEEAARLLRERSSRVGYDLVEVVEDEAATPPAERPEHGPATD
jgi:hypothetical protein